MTDEQFQALMQEIKETQWRCGFIAIEIVIAVVLLVIEFHHGK